MISFKYRSHLNRIQFFYSIAFIRSPPYHTAIYTDVSYQADIAPSEDGYAFHKLSLFFVYEKP
jgi:hypothetical protein